MNKFLKDEDYYNDLYDLWTVEECLRICAYWEKSVKSLKDNEVKMGRWGLDFKLYFVKGERYREKSSSLEKWMMADRKRDEKLNGTEEPKGIYCMKCQVIMEHVFKDLYDMNCDSLMVLFFFECLKCGKRKGVFENGQEYVSKGVKLSKVEMNEWDQEDVERKDREKKNQMLLNKHRAEFCLLKAEGEEYIMSSNRLKDFSMFLKETEQKKVDPDYQKAMKLRKITIVELENFLKGILEKEKYIKLAFDKPLIDKHVIVPLSVQDEDSSRKEYDSVRKLQRVLKKNLECTNWRLMSEGVNYRLGYLSCKLKGYEQEADLVRIVKAKIS